MPLSPVSQPMDDRRRILERLLRHLAPKIPRFEAEAVVDHALLSPGLSQAVPDTAIWLALVAFVRHRMTDYDELLQDGYDPESARFYVREAMTEVLQAWGVKRSLPSEEA